ncbi:thioesterase family protein [Peribacillus kribbensis]|uniref:thioesterase family protein n=1 Tax=Peribacillus kribbensis TaxID=356658 RepID=UPI0003FF23C9|nr:thioesterase [Peribacillus kribbensis]
MLPGLTPGLSQSIEITVTKEMFAEFDGKLVHPVYSTASMVYHMEWASRKILLPHLEGHEEGMGGTVSVKHLHPCPLGAEVQITAVLSEVQDNKIITEVEARSGEKILGIGRIVQIVLPKERIRQLLSR